MGVQFGNMPLQRSSEQIADEDEQKKNKGQGSDEGKWKVFFHSR